MGDIFGRKQNLKQGYTSNPNILPLKGNEHPPAQCEETADCCEEMERVSEAPYYVIVHLTYKDGLLAVGPFRRLDDAARYYNGFQAATALDRQSFPFVIGIVREVYAFEGNICSPGDVQSVKKRIEEELKQDCYAMKAIR